MAGDNCERCDDGLLLEVAYKAIKEARDIITELYYFNNEVRSDIQNADRKRLSDMDYILRGGLGTNENVKKYGVGT